MSRHGQYAEGTVRFQFAMPQELLDDLRKVADEEGTTVSDLLRDGAIWRINNPPNRRRK